MIKRIYTLFILLMVALTSMAQMAEPVKFVVKHAVNDKGQLEVSFQGKIDAGWHVYGTNIKDGGPTAATVTLDKQVGVEVAGKLETIGDVHTINDAMFGMEVETIEGEVTFKQTFNITCCWVDHSNDSMLWSSKFPVNQEQIWEDLNIKED